MKTLYLKIVFIIFFSVIAASASDNKDQIVFPGQQMMGFRGLDTNTSAPLIEDGRAIDLLNVKLSNTFDLRIRDGYKLINDTLDDLDLASPAITGIFDAAFSSGTNFPIVFLGNKIKYDNSGTWTGISGSAVSTSGTNNQFVCIMALDTAICTNDVNPPIEISSTPAHSALSYSGLSSALTKAKTLLWFRNYLISANTVEGSVERPTRFRWSNVGTTETYSDDDYNDLEALGGDEIISLIELYGNIFIFMKNSVWQASLVGGDAVFAFGKILDEVGAISPNAVKVVTLADNTQAICFLDARKRIYLFNGSALIEIGLLIQPTLDDLSASRIQYAVAEFDGDNFLLSATTGSNTLNDTVFVYRLDIGEWTKYDQIDANAFAKVKESDSTYKTYFGNYSAFVYSLDEPDNHNDIDGALGYVDSVGIVNTSTITGAQILIDTGLPSGLYTGAIVKIIAGTGAGEERVLATQTSSGIVVSTAFTTTPDSTSLYKIGSINAYYETKWYSLGSPFNNKNYKELFFWSEEDSDNEVTVSYKEDLRNSDISSVKNSLEPSSASLWDTFIWDVGTWVETGDKLTRMNLEGNGRFINFKFAEDDVDKTFHLYGFGIIADSLDVR